MLPIGYKRFGVKVVDDQEVWDDYHVYFHGTHPDFIKSIVETRSLLLPGDVTKEGIELKIVEGHIKSKGRRFNEFTYEYEDFDPIQFFTSPSPHYSGCSVYAKTKVFK